jgi:hypothetical protein
MHGQDPSLLSQFKNLFAHWYAAAIDVLFDWDPMAAHPVSQAIGRVLETPSFKTKNLRLLELAVIPSYACVLTGHLGF